MRAVAHEREPAPLEERQGRGPGEAPRDNLIEHVLKFRIKLLLVMKLRSVIVLLVLCFFSMRGSAQSVSTFESPEQAAKLLTQGSDAEKVRMKDVLHMQFVMGKECVGAPGDCVAETERGLLEEGKENAILKVKHYYDFALVVLVRNADGAWQFLDSMPLNAAYDYLTVGLGSIVKPPVQEIVVHKHVSDRGTGIFQANFLILKVSHGRLQVVLDAVEESTQSLSEQKSEFKITPASGDVPAHIDEKQTIRVGGKATTREREFVWDENLRTFQVSQW
jgi:hypothetical protein